MNIRRPFYAPEGAGGGGGGGDPPPGGGGGGGGGGGQPYRPEGLPDHLAGASERETLDKVFGAFRGFQSEASKRGAVGKEAKDYAFAPPDPLKPFFSKADDPALASAQAAALKAGITVPQFQSFVADTFGPLVEKGVIGPIFDPKRELDTLSKLIGAQPGQDGKQAVSAAATEASATAEALFGRLKFGDGLPEEVKNSVKGTLLGLADTGGGAFVLNAIKGMLAERGIQLGGAPAGSGSLTKEQLKAMDADPRIDPLSPKFDKATRAQYDAAYKALYPG